jgi:hypothetical protein
MSLQGSKRSAVRRLGTMTQNLYQPRGPHLSKDYLDDAGSESDFGVGQASAEKYPQELAGTAFSNSAPFEPKTWLIRRPRKLDACLFKGPLQVEKRLRAAGRNAFGLF